MSNKQHTELNDNNLAIAYYRYSSHSQRDASIEQQREAAQKLAKSRGYKIVKEYTDRAISGTTADRPGYQQMLSEVGKLRPAALILWKADRLGRDRYNVAIARKTLRDAGCRVIYVADNLPEDDSPEAAIIESLVDAMSEMYSKQLSANVKRGSRHNAERALSNGHKIYGYGTDDKTKRYIIDQDTAPIVRKIFSDYASGKRLQVIVDELNAAGVATRDGKQFTINSLRWILHSRRYIGEYRYDDIVVPGGMPRIIDDETWEKVQRRFEENKR